MLADARQPERQRCKDLMQKVWDAMSLVLDFYQLSGPQTQNCDQKMEVYTWYSRESGSESCNNDSDFQLALCCSSVWFLRKISNIETDFFVKPNPNLNPFGCFILRMSQMV